MDRLKVQLFKNICILSNQYVNIIFVELMYINYYDSFYNWYIRLKKKIKISVSYEQQSN